MTMEAFLVEWLVSSGSTVVIAENFSRGRATHFSSIHTIEIREGDLEQPSYRDEAPT
jgi:hypothetical protein